MHVLSFLTAELLQVVDITSHVRHSTVNILAADNLEIQGARSSAAMVLT